MIAPALDARLRSQRFRAEREASWHAFETIIDKAEKRSATSLSDDDILAAPVLYRSTLSALSVARSTSLDQGLIDYLESLCARGYFFIYGSRASLPAKLAGFFRRDWTVAVAGLWRETLIAAALMFAGTIAAYLLVSQDPDWYFAFVSSQLAGDRTPVASAAALKAGLYHTEGSDGLSVFATYLFTHNSQVALLAFALGFAFCIPTAFLLVQNGAMLGAFFALYISKGLGFELGGWILIHGVTELFAIILAGAAGIKIGTAIAFPGNQARLASMATAGRQAATVMGGVIVMLLVAGLLEGFGRQLITNDLARYAIAGTSAVIWGLYFYAPRPGLAR